MPVLLALLSSALWGLADFLGGTATRRIPSWSVVGGSQAVALVVVLPLVLLTGSFGTFTGHWLLIGCAAGLVGVVALGAFYAALAGGTMGVIAPVASLGALIPVGVGLARGEAPTLAQTAGMVVAIVGVVLASGPELSGGASPRPLLLAVVAAVGFGTVATLIAAGSRGSARSALLTLLVMRATSVGLLLVAMVVLSAGRRVGLARTDLGTLVAIGLADLGANASFAAASRSSLLSVAAVLASLYPVVTVLLARRVHHEVLRPVQVVGAVATLAGVGLLVAG